MWIMFLSPCILCKKMVIEKNKYHVGLERDRQIQVAVAARCHYASLRTMSSQIR